VQMRVVEKLSFAAIGEKIGRHQSSVADRIQKILAGKYFRAEIGFGYRRRA
jgi:hypothetical protein